MEHLPTRTGQAKSVFPAIPYLCPDKYDEGPFLDYPHRSGLPIEIDGTFPLKPTLSGSSQRFLAAVPQAKLEPFMQNWLFFGLLNEVLEGLYRHEDFVTTCSDEEPDKSIVTTADLLLRLEEWEAKITQDKGSLRAVYEHISKCLNLTYACLYIEYPAFDDDLKLHLASVAEVLGYAASKACNVAWTDGPRRSLIPLDWGKVISKHFKKSVLLERSNCCPSQTQMLIEHLGSPQALSFVASCFHEDVVRSDHASCDGNKCQAGDSVTSDHITRHVSDSCSCDFLCVNENLLADCLEKGCLPLLRIKEETNLDKISIEVVPSTNTASYVALSHVWVDGLGNPTATALPRCQISRLKALIDNLDFKYVDTSIVLNHPDDALEMLLWCDTLCCPVVSKEAQSMALRQMYRTYDEASVVLVLDRNLISHRIGGMTVDEACLRIAASRWMTRLWTLQEGALAAKKGRLWFQFTKTALPVQTLYNHIGKVQKTDIQRRGVMDSVVRRFHTFLFLINIESSDNQRTRMNYIMRGLLYRSVTVPSDEPLIIATLLALDLSPILASEPAARMNTLWRIIGTSPSGINKHILFHLCPKLRERGLRWAPQSLLSADDYFAIPRPEKQEDRGFLATNDNARGLVVELAGFRISIAKPAKGLPEHLAGFESKSRNDNDRQRLLLKDCQGRWYILAHRLSDTPARPPALEDMCAVISRLSSPWILYRGSSSLVPECTKAYLGLLVEGANQQQSQSNEVTCAEINSQVSFSHIPTEGNQIFQAAYCLAQELASSAAARRLEDLGTAPTDLDDPVYKEAFQDVCLELQRFSRSPFAKEALAATGNNVDELGSSRIGEYMWYMYRGIYLQIEEYASGNRKWCVD